VKPDDVREAWADIATVFHWPLADLERLGWEDLAFYHAAAVERLELLMKARLATP